MQHIQMPGQNMFIGTTRMTYTITGHNNEINSILQELTEAGLKLPFLTSK